MSHSKLIMKYPTTWWKSRWREGIPLGNGKIGALVYGAIYDETIMLTHEDAWWQDRTPELPDISENLEKVRELMDNGLYEKAINLYVNRLKELNYDPAVAVPLPIGDCRIHMKANSAFKNYSRQLDMDTGEAIVRWDDKDTTFSRRSFVSRENDTFICFIDAKGSRYIDGHITLDLHDIADANGVRGDGLIPEIVDLIVEGEYIYYSILSDDDTLSGAVGRIIALDGKSYKDGKKIAIKESSKVMIMIKVFTKAKDRSVYKKYHDLLANMKGTYSDYFTEHANKHSELFNKAQFKITDDKQSSSNEALLLKAYSGETPDEMIEKMWAYGRYLLISATYEGGKPCPLHGLWCGEYQGFWAFNMANENLQMIYWQALSGNIPKQMLSVFDYYEGMIDDFRENAMKLYGCRGIYIPAPTVPGSGIIKNLQHHIIYWTGAAGWIAQHFYDYYIYTKDLIFLRERALPFMREVAHFYEDFLVEGENGLLMSYPAISPENTPGNLWDGNGMSEAMELTYNPTMDFAIIKELLTNLIKGAKQEDMYADEIELWEDMLNKVPEYQVNEDGAVKEWLYDGYEDNYHHRHESHLYPVFPGVEITKENNPQLFEAFVVAAKKRLVIGLKEQSAWSLVHMACNYARMEEGDLALECLEIMSRSCVLNNFFTTHNDWRNMGITVDLPFAPFQIDANMGWTGAILEMCLFSTENMIRLLPAIPKRWRKGEALGMLARGGIEVSIKWDYDIRKIRAKLEAKYESIIDVKLPFDIISVKDANSKDLNIDGNYIKGLKLKENEVLDLSIRF